jgi:2'-5' RNA ligase
MQNEPLALEEELVEDDELFESEPQESEAVARRMAFLILSVGMQPSVCEVVKTLKDGGLQLDWSDPESYHVTLVGFYCDAEPVIQYPPFGQGYGLTASSLGVFNNESGSGLHLAIDPDMMLRDYQAMLAGLVRWNGYELSAYSEPDMWTPHITLGYSSTPLESLPLLQEPVMIPTGAVALSVDALEEDEDFEILEVKSSFVERFISAFNSLVWRNKGIDFERESGFKLIGSNRWVAWYTNAYQDRDGEWFSEKSIEADISRMNKMKEFPELWFWHIPGTRMGQADAAVKVGRFAVATGTFDETPYAQAMKRYLKKHGRKYTLSHGFKFPRTALVDGVYHQHATFEISPLLANKASNPLTLFYAMEEGSKMSNQIDPVAIETMREALKGSNITVEQILAAGLGATKQADDETGHNYKGESEMEAGTKEAIDGLRADIQALTAVLTVNAKAAAVPKSDPEDDETEGEAEDQMKPKRKSAVEDELEAMRAEIKALRDENAAKAQTIQGAQIASILGDYMAQGGAAQQQKSAEQMPFGMGAMKAMKAMGVED